MKDQSKTKQMLIQELVSLRQRTEELAESVMGRKEAEEALRESESRMRAITDSAQDAILMMDPEGRISYWNPAAERILGYTSAEAIGQNLHALIVPSRYREAYHAARPVFQQKGQGGAVGKTLDLEARRKDGKEISVQLSLSTIHMKGAWNAVGILRDSTDRRLAEEKIEEAWAFTESTLNSITDIFYSFDLKGKFIKWNETFCRVSGYSDQELSSKKPMDFFSSKDIQRVTKSIEKIFKEGAAKVDADFVTKDGRQIPCEFTGSILKDGTDNIIGFSGSARDLTERIRAEKELQESEERYRVVFEKSINGILEIDLETMRFSYANPAICRMFGYSETEFMPLGIKDIHPADFLDHVKAEFELLRRGEKTLSSGLPCLRKDGTVFYADITAVVAIINGRECIVGFFADITERKEIEAGLEKTHKELNEVAIELERAARVKSEFLASMSHELRTPLNAVIGFSQVLQDQDFGPLNEKQKEYMLDILESGNHLLSLINDILDLSKVEAGKMELQLSPVVIGDLLAGSLVMIKEKAMKLGITLETDIPEELSHFEMLADERKFKQILFNLLSNASKFTPNGGAIMLSARRMAEGEGEVIQVSVKDTGIGIAPEHQAKVFESFYQASGGLTSKTSGTGLGLPLARSFVNLHGGRMWVESEGDGKGSQFYFTLPVQPVFPEIGKHVILRNHLKRFICFSKRQDKTFALCFLYMKGDNLQLKIHEIDAVMEKNKRAYDFSMFEEEGIITLLLQDIDQDSARMICERIVTDIKSKFATFETSFSLVSYPSDGDKPEELLEKVKAAPRYQTSTHSEQVKGK